MKTILGGLAAIAVLAAPGAAMGKGPKAEAALEARSESTVTGKVTFSQHGKKVAMKVVVSGLPGSVR